MKRGLTVAVAGVAIVVAGISGCSSNKPSSSGSTAVSVSGTSIAVGAGGGTPPTVTIDGKNQNITGTVVCAAVGGNTSITIGSPGTGVTAMLTSDNPPQVKSVVLGNVNGANLAYTAGTGQGDASATKNGNSYKITGTAVDMANPMAPVKKPFEIDASCS